jgi:outer membrane protein OmpA-like peptidoglycan-associated protein
LTTKLPLFFFCAFLASINSLALAESNIYSVSQLSDPLYTLGGTARATAMGDAFAGVADDAASLLYNPAGLGWMDMPELGIHHNSWLVDSYRETLLLGLPLSTGGGLAAEVSYMDWGSFEIRDDNGTLDGTYTDKDLEAAMGWGMKLWGEGEKGFSIGLTLRGLKDHLYENDDFGLSGDLGALWAPYPIFRLGLAYTHLGTDVEGSSQESSFRAAASLYNVAIGRTATLTLAAATAIEPSGVSQLELGGESWIASILALRLGYDLSLSDNELGGLNSVTGGIGFRYQDYEIDYSYLPYGDLGTSQWVSLTYKPLKPAATPLPSAVATPLPVMTPTPSRLATPSAADKQQELDLKDAGVETARLQDNSLQVTLASNALKFQTMSFNLRVSDKAILAKLAAILKRNPQNRIDIEGHTDNKGDDSYNNRLSLRRARSVRDALLDAGLPIECIRSVKGYGSELPVDTNRTEAGRARNRRVVLGIHMAPGTAQPENPLPDKPPF